MTTFSQIPLVTMSRRISITVYEAKYHRGYQIRGEFSNHESVELYSAVIGRNRALINTTDYVSFEQDGEVRTSFMITYHNIESVQQVKYGQLDHCFATSSGEKVALMRLFREQQDEVSELDCPLLQLTDIYDTVKTSRILASASIVHQCSGSCKYSRDSVGRTIEREKVEQDSLIFVHDITNTNYSLNIYCMQQF